MRRFLRGGLLVWAWAAGGLSLSCGQNLGPQAVASALQRAYPGWVEVVPGTRGPEFQVDGRRFAWAEQRLLPWDQQDDWAAYSPQPFYAYPAEEPDVASWSEDALAQAEAHLLGRRNDAPKRSSAFFNALWSIHDRGTADAAQRRIRFFGLPVTVHRSLVAPLGRIEARLNGLRATDPALEAFLKNLKGFDGYNWRDIAETQSRSNHAYGAAIDLIARSYGGKNPYWLWAPQEKPGWYKAAWARRWQVPRVVVKAFEDEGFVWGGKWLLFDTIHFEYRPEILILNGLR